MDKHLKFIQEHTKEGGLSFLLFYPITWKNDLVKIFICVVLFSVLFASCKHPSDSTNNVDSILLSGANDISSTDFNSLFRLSLIVTLEAKENSLIKDLTKIGVYKEHIYILDKYQRKIFVFDKEGRFIREYFHLGQSEGEYLSIDDFEIKDNNLFLYDGLKGFIYIYDLPSDIFVRKIETLKGSGIKVWDDNKFAINLGFSSANPKGKKQNFSYVFYDYEKPVHFDIPYNEFLTGHSQRFDYGSNFFFNYQDTTFTLFLLNDTIYYMNKNGSLSPYLHLDFGIARPSLKDSKECINNYFKEGKNDSPSSVFSLYKFERKLLLSYFFDRRRKYVIIDLSNDNVLFNGILRDKENGLPVRITPYSQFDYSAKAENQLLSVIWPFEIKENESNKHLFDKIDKNGNPYLIYYDYFERVK